MGKKRASKKRKATDEITSEGESKHPYIQFTKYPEQVKAVIKPDEPIEESRNDSNKNKSPNRIKTKAIDEDFEKRIPTRSHRIGSDFFSKVREKSNDRKSKKSEKMLKNKTKSDSSEDDKNSKNNGDESAQCNARSGATRNTRSGAMRNTRSGVSSSDLSSSEIDGGRSPYRGRPSPSRPIGSMLNPVYSDDPVDFDMTPLEEQEHVAYNYSLTKESMIHVDSKRVILSLHHPHQLSFTGKVRLGVLHGAVSVLGYHIYPNGITHPVYSPECNNYITIVTESTTAQHIHREDIQSLGELCNHYDIATSIYNKLKKHENDPEISLLLLENLDCDVCRYLSSVPGNTELLMKQPKGYKERPDLLPQESDVILKEIGVYLQDSSAPVVGLDNVTTDVCDTFVKRISANSGSMPIVAVCGGKSVGKSTLSRILINKALNCIERVAYLDCDLGQTEFTAPGMVSLSIVDTPVLGPPFTHQRETAIQIYVGAVSPADCVLHYLRCLRRCYQKYQDVAPSIPLIVNTMGWNQGMGIVLLAETFDIIRPTTVIQIDHMTQNKNYPPITGEFIFSASRFLETDVSSSTSRHQDHELFITSSLVIGSNQRRTGFGAPDLRGFSLMSSFAAPILSSFSRSLTGVSPYEVPWSSVAVHVCNNQVPRSQILYSLNASVVGLCKLNTSLFVKFGDDLPMFLEETPVTECLGLAIIRGIDPNRKIFYVVTSLPTTELSKINVFLKGAVDIPQSYLIHKKPVGKPMPYMDDYKAGKGTHTAKRIFKQYRKYADRL
ncbi:unnamed protein product [Owenia fusiformis]|uniref:Polynucleotide 5'-hydroxyl-kinase NOL9 n=1 Tax=Owenia fusiformis TaxID=6347 RepID=A0A8S4NNX5_OWEFU|nr:unnamed protein product [Owenia fusiformis]